MNIKTSVELIYQGLGVADNGSPINLEYSEVVRCDELKQFSVNYYNDQQRNMRKSRNLIVPTYLVEDREIEGKRYELMYCVYDGRKYKVKNILTERHTRQTMILDIEEVR